jgi:ribosomal-protein-alanine N-acetyltransferase
MNGETSPACPPTLICRYRYKSLPVCHQAGVIQYGVRFTVRDFHSNDFETLLSIDQECFAPGISYSRAELWAYMGVPGSFTLVAEVAGEPAGPEHDSSVKARIVGFVVANLNRALAGHIITIDVLPVAQRSGVGSALLRGGEERLAAGGCKWIRLEAAVNNAAALAFYKRHGYSVVRTIPEYYPDGLDAFVLKKDLRSSLRDR